jgi:hypothetical protein
MRHRGRSRRHTAGAASEMCKRLCDTLPVLRRRPGSSSSSRVLRYRSRRRRGKTDRTGPGYRRRDTRTCCNYRAGGRTWRGRSCKGRAEANRDCESRPARTRTRRVSSATSLGSLRYRRSCRRHTRQPTDNSAPKRARNCTRRSRPTPPSTTKTEPGSRCFAYPRICPVASSSGLRSSCASRAPSQLNGEPRCGSATLPTAPTSRARTSQTVRPSRTRSRATCRASDTRCRRA